MTDCILILDNIRSVENTGSIFRTADGLGVAKIVLVGTTPAPIDRFGRKRSDFAKVALGAEESVPWEHVAKAGPTLKELEESGYQIISLEQTERSEGVQTCQPQAQFALVVGNEVHGVSPEILEVSDKVVSIPMQGMKESLNVAVATGIALFMLI